MEDKYPITIPAVVNGQKTSKFVKVSLFKGTFRLSHQSSEKMFWRCWVPSVPNFSARVIIHHGLHEHSGRYAHLAHELCASSCIVYSFDYLGHGQSDGLRGLIESLTGLVQQAVTFFQLVKNGELRTNSQEIQDEFEEATMDSSATKFSDGSSTPPPPPLFVFGQGVGGTLAIHVALKVDGCSGIVMSAPLVLVPPKAHILLQKLAGILSALVPHAPVADIDFNQRCHSESEVRIYKSDPLCYAGKMRARTGYLMLECAKEAQTLLGNITFPFLVMQGSEDRTCDPKGTSDLYAKAKSVDKTMKMYEGFWHDLLHEVCADDFIIQTVKWILARCPVKKQQSFTSPKSSYRASFSGNE